MALGGIPVYERLVVSPGTCRALTSARLDGFGPIKIHPTWPTDLLSVRSSCALTWQDVCPTFPPGSPEGFFGEDAKYMGQLSLPHVATIVNERISGI